MVNQQQYCNPEIWGGIECTINRVGNDFYDQLHFSGHYHREDDIDQIAALGVRKLRYPLLWEKHQPSQDTDIDWSWASKQLASLREKKIDVIAGLVHHGSGPAFTNLLDVNFPELLASYAGKVARQFPWIEYYTPVNEPLTTARFSGLYGFWYPHQTDNNSFIRMLLNELKATVLSMIEIRKINPQAKLVQTEDLGKTYSTETLKYQADFENERRWLTYDILCGRFDETHPLWSFFREAGIGESELRFFLDNPTIPDIFGFNHYLTSERYLDEQLSSYPDFTHGGNGKHSYADVEAVRVQLEEPIGIKTLLKEAWERYGQPMAITEVHLHCHREEQLRWFNHIWGAVNELRTEGVDIKAVTSWAVLGSFGWNKLLTEAGGEYEPGIFDLRGGNLRPTALAAFIKDLAHKNQCDQHLSKDKGWWQRESRLIYGSCSKTVQMISTNTAPVLIIGRTGTLGTAFARICQDRCIHYHLLGRQDCDISSYDQVEKILSRYRPWAVINAAGYVRVDEAESDSDACYRDNTAGPHNLAVACQKFGVQLISFSSDLVFDGKKTSPYVESDLTDPLNVYGRSKAWAELQIQEACASSLIIRTSAFFGPWDDYNFVQYVRRSLSHYQPIKVARDIMVSPSYVPHLVNAALDILIDRETGIWHLSNKGAVSWADWAYLVAEQFGLDSSLIHAVPADQLNYPAKRPLNSILASERGQLLPTFETAMKDYLSHQKPESRKVA